VRFVHQPEDDLVVLAEAACELAPEAAEVLDGGGGGVAVVTDDGPGEGLGGGVAVTEVVVGVENGVGT
jgi:hypothetical protein